MLIDSLQDCFASAKRKNWDKIYIAVDIHDTIVKGNYKTDELPTEFLPEAKETLQYLSARPDVVLILYTCSHPVEVFKYFDFFTQNDIEFKYCNENPEVPNNALGCYTHKLYFNLLFDDKGCFCGRYEWPFVREFFEKQPLLTVKKETTA